MNGRTWSMTEEAAMKRMSGAGFTLAQAATALGRSFGSASSKAVSMGLNFRRDPDGPNVFAWQNGPRFTETFTHGACRGSVTADTPEAARAVRDALLRCAAVHRERRTRRAA